MNMEKIIETVRRIVIEEIQNDDIRNDATLLENGMDSITMINVVTILEEEFQIEFDPEKLTYETLKTINSISKYIQEELEKKQAD